MVALGLTIVPGYGWVVEFFLVRWPWLGWVVAIHNLQFCLTESPGLVVASGFLLSNYCNTVQAGFRFRFRYTWIKLCNVLFVQSQISKFK